jgi:hypothetical protein
VETFHRIILQIIYRTHDILYLIYSEGWGVSIQYSSLRTRLNIELSQGEEMDLRVKVVQKIESKNTTVI